MTAIDLHTTMPDIPRRKRRPPSEPPARHDGPVTGPHHPFVRTSGTHRVRVEGHRIGPPPWSWTWCLLAATNLIWVVLVGLALYFAPSHTLQTPAPMPGPPPIVDVCANVPPDVPC